MLAEPAAVTAGRDLGRFLLRLEVAGVGVLVFTDRVDIEVPPGSLESDRVDGAEAGGGGVGCRAGDRRHLSPRPDAASVDVPAGRPQRAGAPVSPLGTRVVQAGSIAYRDSVSDVPGSVGQVLAGRYRLESLLGRGGMGCVWRAEHVTLGTPVAIKLIRNDVATRPGALKRFLREARAAAMLRSAHVVQVLDHGVEDGAPYIAMECLEGESLAARLRREEKLGVAGTAEILSGVCRGLARAHEQGIIHRDLKPDNIFIAREEAASVVKVLDFGIAKMIGPQVTDSQTESGTANRTETGAMLGTPRYMSPEQARGRTDLDGRSDLWALAVIAFECLVGKRPFEAEMLGELILQICSDPIPVPSSMGEVPPGFDAWFARATQRKLEDRFQTVRELADALSEVLTPDRGWLGISGEVPPSAVVALSPSDAAEESVSPSVQHARPTTGPPRSRARYAFVVSTAAIAVAGVALASRVVGGSDTSADGSAAVGAPAAPASPALVAAAPGPSAPSPAASSSASRPADEGVLRVQLAFAPSDASVEIDGVVVPARAGEVEIVGTLGSVHRVRIFKGKAETSAEVSITDHGAMPARLSLLAPAPKGAPAPARAPARAHSFDE